MERTTVNRRYRVDRRIGEGGMAEVYLGHDLLLNRAVAVKVMRPHHAADPVFRTRFEREAIAVAGLTHPNIVEIFDVGEENGRPYFVMEFVRGDTLKTVIVQEGPFAPDDVAALLEQVCSALDCAHEQGIVHRDVKPQNILVTPDGVVKVLDFGIAKDVHDGHLTEVGNGLGTVQYVSPEQANGLMATPSSDVYSLGVVAFEMLTGRLPFEADSPVATAMLHVHEPPRPPSTVFPHVPPQVDGIVLRALEKNPTRRFQTAGAFAQAMTDWRTHPIASERGRVDFGWPAPPVRPLPSPPVAHAPAQPVAATPVGSNRPSGSAPPARSLDPVPVAAPPLAATGDNVGCTTWLVGSLVLAALVALVWIGFRLSPGFADRDADAPTAVAADGDIALDATEPGEPAAATGAPAPTNQSAPSGQQQTRSVPVPDLIGKSVSEAQNLLTDRGLLFDDGDPVFSDSVPPDVIAEQDPPAQSLVEQGTIVVIKLSRGSASVSIADLDLVGLDAAEAERRLTDEGVGAKREEIGDPSVPAGRVVAVDPATSAQVGETVLLYVSVGDKLRVPPEIIGRPLGDVERQIERLGLVVSATSPLDQEEIDAEGIDLEADGVGAGDVVGYTTTDGETELDVWLDRGTEITLSYYQPFPDADAPDDAD